MISMPCLAPLQALLTRQLLWLQLQLLIIDSSTFPSLLMSCLPFPVHTLIMKCMYNSCS